MKRGLMRRSSVIRGVGFICAMMFAIGAAFATSNNCTQRCYHVTYAGSGAGGDPCNYFNPYKAMDYIYSDQCDGTTVTRAPGVVEYYDVSVCNNYCTNINGTGFAKMTSGTRSVLVKIGTSGTQWLCTGSS